MSSGVYIIENLETGDRYVGSAAHIASRWAKHRHDLRNGLHHSTALQQAWHKYGEDAFLFEVWEECEPELLLELEQSTIDELRPRYNVNPLAGSSLGIKRSPETRRRISKAMKGNRNARSDSVT